ncbi:hypothetical protein K8I31_22170, partial [bacterium]|nr:hypothetical protein [bacterium]
MKKHFAFALIAAFLFSPIVSWSATKNVGDNPTFIVLQAISNGWDQLAAGTLDIEVEIEGSVVYRLSEDTSFVGDGSNSVGRGNWKTVIIDLIEYPNSTAVLRIVDNSNSRFIAVNAA